MEPKSKREKRYRKHKRARAKIYGTAKVPRFCVFRSNKHIYAQLIDDEKNHVLVAANDLKLKGKTIRKRETLSLAKATEDKTRKVAIAYEVGKLIAKEALEKKIEKVVFDRGGYKYHGRVKALAEGAREGGLKF